MKNNKIKILVFFLILFVLISGADFAYALTEPEIQYPPTAFPDVETPNVFIRRINNGDPGYTPETAFARYVKYFYSLSLEISALLIFVSLLYGGFLYMVSGNNPGKVSDARDQISSAFLGFIVLVFSYIILVTINPQFIILSLKLPVAPQIEPCNCSASPIQPQCVDFCRRIEEQPIEYAEIPLGRLNEIVILQSKVVRDIAEEINAAGGSVTNLPTGGTGPGVLPTLATQLNDLASKCDCAYARPNCLGEGICSPAPYTNPPEVPPPDSNDDNCNTERGCKYSDPCLCTACVGGLITSAVVGIPPSDTTAVNLVDYFFPGSATGVNLSNGEFFRVESEGNGFYKIIKSHDSRYYERFRVENGYIDHYEDTTWANENGNIQCNNGSGEAYFSLLDYSNGSPQNTCPVWDPSREGMHWAPQFMSVPPPQAPQAPFYATTTVIGFSKSNHQCCDTAYTGPADHGIQMIYKGCVVFPTQVTRQDVVVLRNTTGIGANETFFYDRELGWVGFHRGIVSQGAYISDAGRSNPPPATGTMTCWDLAGNSGVEFASTGCDPCNTSEVTRAEIVAKQSEIMQYDVIYEEIRARFITAEAELEYDLLNLKLAEDLLRNSETRPVSFENFIQNEDASVYKILPWRGIDISHEIVSWYGDAINYNLMGESDPERDSEDPATFYIEKEANKSLIQAVERAAYSAPQPGDVPPDLPPWTGTCDYFASQPAPSFSNEMRDYALFASSRTGVRASLILALLSHESGFTRFGSPPNGWLGRYPSSYCSDAQASAFSSIWDEVWNAGFRYDDFSGNTYTDKSNVPLSGIGDIFGVPNCGGAMGPAQAMPLTWNGFKAEVQRIVDVSTASPWEFQHAFVFTGLFLRSHNADSMDCIDEMNSLLRYWGTDEYASIACLLIQRANAIAPTIGEAVCGGSVAPPVPTGDWQLPFHERTVLSSTFQDHYNRCQQYGAWDLTAPYGTNVYPTRNGRVITSVGSGCTSRNGCYVRIDHGDGWISSYIHLIPGSTPAVGTTVTTDSVIGRVGCTGATSFGPHVHFQVYHDYVLTDPATVFGTPQSIGLPYSYECVQSACPQGSWSGLNSSCFNNPGNNRPCTAGACGSACPF